MRNEVTEVVTLLVCPDCLYASHYGVNELDLPKEEEERILHGLSHWPRTSFSVEESEEPFFSHSPCDLCGGRAGTRSTLNALRW